MKTLKKSRVMVPFLPISLDIDKILKKEVELFSKVVWNNLILSGIKAKEDPKSIFEGSVEKSDSTNGYKFHIVTTGSVNDDKLEIHVNKTGRILVTISAFIVSTGKWETHFNSNHFISMNEFESIFSSIIDRLR